MNEERWDEVLRQRQEDVDRLVDKHGLPEVKEALENYGWTKKRGKQGGHPKFYGHQELMEISAFVQDGITREGLSVHEFCETHRFSWVIGGCRDVGRAIVKSVQCATLRRRYYEAEAVLKREAELDRVGAKWAGANLVLSAGWWRRGELARLRLQD